MVDERQIAKYAALIATGAMTEEALLEELGDDSIVAKVMAVSGATVVTTAVSGVVENTIDTAFDVVDELNLNPFKW